MKVLINYKLNDELKIKILKEAPKSVNLVFSTDEKETLEEVKDADAVFGFLTLEMLRAAEKLKWNQTPMAGLEEYIPKIPEIIERDIVITNVAGIYNEEVATHVFALITALSRDLPTLIRRQDRKIWDAENLRIIPLLGKTLGIVGLGRIGTEVAKRGAAFGMKVIATRAHPEKGKPSFVEKIWGLEGLNNLLRESDFVVICTPHTPKTEKMIRAKELRIMKRTAFLINIGRGAVVDLNDLAEALRKNEIAGAGLDVFEEEPLPPEHPLWKLRNVIITPHIAAKALIPLYEERRVNIFLENLRRFVNGDPLINVVDKKMWY
ncbi:TPA: D-2-hydroxyacid dehydrogenase [Candidatus Bathyarchaeota archaeon]|nr:D-2-hydroxyacid dehydrogenase [Candidatus Bathyarchaeota archaeon]